MPKKSRPSELKDYRLVALTSNIMKTLDRLVQQLLGTQVQHGKDPLQFAYQAKVGVEDSIFYLLHPTLSYLDLGTAL